MKNTLEPEVSRLEIEKEFNQISSLANMELKNFVMDYISEFEFKMQKKYEKINEDLKQRVADAEKKLENHDVKINSVQDEAQKNQNKIDKINDLSLASKKNTDQILTNEIRLNSLQKEFSYACYKYDKIFLDNLHIPGTVGDFCTYKNLRDYVESSISQVQSLLSYKEKNNAEFKAYKEKFENLVVGISSQLENSEKNMKNFTTLMLKDTEVNLKRECENISLKISELRMENNKHAIELKKNASELTTEKESMMVVQEKISKEIEELQGKTKEDNLENDSFYGENNMGSQQNVKNKRIQSSGFNKDFNFSSDSRAQSINWNIIENNSNRRASKIDNNAIKSFDNEKFFYHNNDTSNYFKHKKVISSKDRRKFLVNKSEKVKVQSYLRDYIKGDSSKFSFKKKKSNLNYIDQNTINKQPITAKKSTNVKTVTKEEGIKRLKESIECTRSLISSQKINYKSDLNLKRNVLSADEKSEFNKETQNHNFNTEKNPTNNFDLPESINNTNENVIISQADNSYFAIENRNNLKNLNVKADESLPVEFGNAVDLPFNDYLNKNANGANRLRNSSKFKEKFPATYSQARSSIDKNLRFSWSLEKIEKEDLMQKESISNQLLKIISNQEIKSKSDMESNGDSYKRFAKIFNEFSESFFLFKKDFIKKLVNTEQRIIQIDHFSKKKFEELANQIKKHLPITFNADIRDLKDKAPDFGSTLNANLGEINFDRPIIINKNNTAGNNEYEKNVLRDPQVNLKKKNNVIPDKNSFRNFYLNSYANFSKSNNSDFRREHSSKK